ncbi:MAG: hypothetical protein KID02_15805 [Clostridiales bacterium]|nr:hypothetical protein [Clostridiales bacterium]
MNLHDQAVKMASQKIASNPKVYRAYTDPLLYEMLVEECEVQLNFSAATFQINALREMAYEQGLYQIATV